MQTDTTITLAGKIPADWAGQRLDRALAQLFPEYSRERLKTWLLAGDCLVNGKALRPKDKVAGDEDVQIRATLEPETESLPEDIPLDVIYEDQEILIINKPAGLVVHPGSGNKQGTLLNSLLHHYPELSNIPRAGIVHRLDKDTSGLMVIAKNLSSHTSLVEQLQARSIKRMYVTVVHGTLIAGDTIDAPIDRHPKDRLKMAVVDDGKEAITHYRIIEKFTKHTYLQVQLETGRTHQIRVHMSYINHPLVGDRLYNSRYQHFFARQALHAKELELIHPKTKQTIHFTAPIPEDFLGLLKELRSEESTNS